MELKFMQTKFKKISLQGVFFAMAKRISTGLGFELAFMFLVGALGYGLLEISWRGFTHWSMLFAGGLCFSLIYWLNLKTKLHFFSKCLLAMVLITIVEFSVGVVVNKIFAWNVWDYSGLPLNLWGQVCLFFSVFWLILSVPFNGLAHYFAKWWHKLEHKQTEF